MNDTTPIVALLEKIEHHMDKLVSFMSKGTGMMAGEVVSMPTRAVSGFSPGMRNAVIGKSGPVQGAAADLRRDPREPIAFPVAKTFRTRFRPESLPRPIESARGEDRPIIKNIVKIASPVRGENAGGPPVQTGLDKKRETKAKSTMALDAKRRKKASKDQREGLAKVFGILGHDGTIMQDLDGLALEWHHRD